MIPSFPSDATIPSIHLACFRTGQHSSLKSSIRDTYGQQGHIHNQLGFRASSFNDRVLHGAMDVAELMDRHSMFSLISSIVNPTTAVRLREALALGDVKTYMRCRALHDHGIKKITVLRQCPSCVREDVDMFGTGHWRVMHQVPAGGSLPACSMKVPGLGGQSAQHGRQV